MPRWPWPAAAAAALLLGLGVWQWQRGGVDQDGRLQTDFYACANLAPDLAIPACDRAIGSGSYAGMELAGLYNDRGNAHMDKGELDMALADLDEAIRLNPRNFVAFWNRAAVYAAKNDFERARSDFTNALALNPDETSKQKIVEALNAVAVNPSAKAASDDPLVITTPTWASPGSDSSAAEASVPALTYPPAALPASPPMATIPAFPASPSPMPAR
jgi:tetratricopeptide (TPR) repeat protein